ncbi:hypothetical protein BGW80DRAFT_1203161 [Lactifluus volemus]|nr:hypothetical protein BGW80DRAFT_1203161 [Lactifluus volemus]
MSRTQIYNRLPIAICLMDTTPSIQTRRIFSGTPRVSVTLPGWSLRESLGRALSFYRASSIIVSQPDTDYQLERGVISPKFGISDAFISFSGSLSEKPDKRATLHVVVVPPPVREDKQIQRIQRKPSRWIRFGLWFNTYRKFFTLIILLNILGLDFAIMGVWTYARRYMATLVLGHLLTAVLVRNELFGRFLYLLVNKLFAKSTPLWFRLGCTSALQHLGGVHSGCAISGFAWLIYHVVVMFKNRESNPSVILFLGTVTSLALAICIGSAFPWVRNKHHNVFERHHRFIGWLGLVFTWMFVILGESYDVTTRTWNSVSSTILHKQEFWLCLCMTIFILTPWLTVRKVKVVVEVPSSKVAIIRFERGMQQGLLARISRSSIMEYHAFGIISEGTQAKSHYLICGIQGDFTRKLVSDPPTHLWTRQLKFAGVSNTSTLYRRGIRVCTGTGIGAALSTCLQVGHPLPLHPSREAGLRLDFQNSDWYLIWIGSEQEKTFGPTISGLIHRHIEPERMTLWDSKKAGGRPNVMKIVKEVYVSWGAEVVFITSNLQGNQEIMEGCMEAKIPAFGTLWDF